MEPLGKEAAWRGRLEAAVDDHQNGRLEAAEAGYRAALALAPAHPDTLHLLGVLCHQRGRNDEAVDLIRRAIALDGSVADFHSNLGVCLKTLGRTADAVAAFRSALRLRPEFPAAACNLGDALATLGEVDEALAWHRRALAAEPGNAEFRYNFANALKDAGDIAEAIAQYERAIALRPDYAAAYNNLGTAHVAREDHAGARRCFERALELDPGNARAHCNFGNLHRRNRDHAAARDAYARALALEPGYFDATAGLADALGELNDVDGAVALLRGLAASHDGNHGAHWRLGNALSNASRFAEGEQAYRRSIALAPASFTAWGNYLFFLNYRSDVSVARGRALHDAFEASAGVPLQAQWRAHANLRDPERRLRIGYVSPDFRLHSCSFFLMPLLARHDRTQVELFAYAEQVKVDNVTQRFKSIVDHWRPIERLTGAQAADLVREDGIDILVDLAGHTDRNRLDVLARKPAPVQVTWLGSPASTGLSAVDYRLTDAIADPPGAEAGFVETLIRLPRGFLCYRAPDDMTDISPLPARATGQVTFGCTNNVVKLNERVVAVWAEVLRAVPHARLVIRTQSLDRWGQRRRLEALFADAPDIRARVEIRAERRPSRAHYASYAEIDIALDPFPYNGTTTTCEALWLGVPTVTLRGDRHGARVGASLLTQVGLEELIADTPAEYVARAAALAGDLDRLAALRAGLRERMRASPLCDEAGFARAMEDAYRAMWRRWCGSAG